jgi:hypothetical protein
LAVPDVLRGTVRLLVAAVVGGVRLIDNDGMTLDAPGREDLVLAHSGKER